MSIDNIAPDLDGAELRIGIVQARFNAWAGEALLAACLGELANLGVDEDDITLLTVPGALEVPLALQTLAATADFDALIGLGCVIRGETYHFEIVAQQSAAGLARISLDHHVPVVNAILTTENDDQAKARVAEKGAEAARVAVEMANLLWALEEDGSQDAE
jgi:6,7-dimethyl-8-ribityllumazine synthase